MNYQALGAVYVATRAYDDGIAAYKKAIDLGASSQVQADLAHAYAVSGRTADATRLVEQLIERSTRTYISPFPSTSPSSMRGCAGRRAAPHKGHSVNHARENPVNGSYRQLVALDQQADHVTAAIRDPDGSTRTVTAAYVAGCDGSRSTVRELSGIAFPGAPCEHAFFVADTEAVGPMVADELNVLLWRSGFHLYFPMKGTNRWRVIGILPNHLLGKDDVAFEDLIPAALHVGGARLSFTACHWFSMYRIHHRCTERFRDRRCFVLGDAAHIHSPMGGQGMNTGLQDAYQPGMEAGARHLTSRGPGAARHLRG